MGIGFYLTLLGQAALRSDNKFWGKFYHITAAIELDPTPVSFSEAELISILFCRLGDLYRYLYTHFSESNPTVREIYWQQSLESYSASIIENPENGLAYNNSGVLYAAKRQVMTALEYYCKASYCQNTRESAVQNVKGLLAHYRDDFDPAFLQRMSEFESTTDAKNEQEIFILNTLFKLASI